MKQRRHGKKVYNWHRPLGRYQLRRRFLRGRETATSVDAQIAEFDDNASLADLDIWPYEIANYCCESCYEESLGYADADEQAEHALKTLLDTLLHPSAWLSQLDQAKTKLESSLPAQAPFTPINLGPIEQRLAQHVTVINDFASDPAPLRQALEQSTCDSQRLALLRQSSQQINAPYLARLIALFSPFWLRDPLQWKKGADVQDLLRFLFIKHDVPGFLFPTWFFTRDLNPAHLKWLLWFIIIGQGGSLKRAAKFFPWAISGKYQHHLSGISDQFDPPDAALLAEVKRLGGSLAAYQRLAAFRFFAFDPSDDTYPHRSFWTETLYWLLKHEGSLSDEDCRDILQWAIHEYTEGGRQGRANFTWKSRSPRACKVRADRYFESLNQPLNDRRWKSKNWDQAFTDKADVNWSLTELTSGRDLAREGQLMRHCVASYTLRCQSGYAAIFSLKKEGIPSVTVEVDLAHHRVVQARGKLNRPATDEENAAISHWFASIQISPSNPANTLQLQ